MKTTLFALACFLTIQLSAQDGKLQCDYKIEKISEGKFKTAVIGFDSLSKMESCFLSWMNTGKGKPDGELLVYDENGKKRRLAIYKGGIRVGKHLEWYSTGEFYSETNWETDLYFNSRSYFKSGKIESTAVNGNRDNAVYTEYYENGKINSETSYTPPIEKTYYDNGQIKSDKSATKKTYTEWHSNGRIKLTGSLDERVWGRIGKWSYYDEKGKLVRELFYKPNNEGWYGTDKGYYKEVKY
jgi:antitoxin component YwqK of YwqJK toxin-antitoxin module